MTGNSSSLNVVVVDDAVLDCTLAAEVVPLAAVEFNFEIIVPYDGDAGVVTFLESMISVNTVVSSNSSSNKVTLSVVIGMSCSVVVIFVGIDDVDGNL